MLDAVVAGSYTSETTRLEIQLVHVQKIGSTSWELRTKFYYIPTGHD